MELEYMLAPAPDRQPQSKVIISDNELAVLTGKGRPLTKKETNSLLDFIEASKIIQNRTTNAITNKLKVDEWNRITEGFNATISSCPRTPNQLRLKWENLKKNARKRKIARRADNDLYPDEILDRVSAMLTYTSQGLTVQYGGDAESRDSDNNEVIAMFTIDKMTSGDDEEPTTDPLKPAVLTEIEVDVRDASACFALGEENKPKDIENTPRTSGLKRKLTQDEGRTARNIAIAKYYTVKRKLLEGKLDNILLQNEKLRLELEKIKQSL